MPAIVSLIAATYSGQQRALAFGIIGGVAGAAIAAGPLIGGWVTTEFSWRYVFAGETVIVAVILLVRAPARALARGRAPPAARRRRRRCSRRSGSGLAVFGILKSSEWGWIEPRGALTIGGEEITPFGFSVVPFFILAGLGFLAAFAHVGGAARARRAATRCSTARCCRIAPLRAGLTTLMMQQLILLGTFFVLPVYLQVVLGLDAFETGKRLFPMSVTMFIAAMAGPEARRGPRPQARRAGRACWRSRWRPSSCSARSTSSSTSTEFALALALFGVGAGLLLSQLGNVIMSSVDPAKTNEAGGLQGTAQNLGASLGTALIGSVLIAALTTGFVDARRAEPGDPAAGPRAGRRGRRRRASPSCRSTTSSRRRSTQGVPADQAQAIADDYGDAQLDGPQARDRRRRDLRPALAVVHAAPARAGAAGGQEPSFSRQDELSASMSLFAWSTPSAIDAASNAFPIAER